ncbi:uncharacterized protein METZ01_LOCUS243553, partial [marine metagenome]
RSLHKLLRNTENRPPSVSSVLN